MEGRGSEQPEVKPAASVAGGGAGDGEWPDVGDLGCGTPCGHTFHRIGQDGPAHRKHYLRLSIMSSMNCLVMTCILRSRGKLTCSMLRNK